MADHWLKALGTSEPDGRLADDWRSARGGLFRNAITFGAKPGVAKGDDVVLYATGTGLFFAAAKVTSHPYLSEEDSTTKWPWQVNIELERWRDFIHDGELLETMNVGDRDLRMVIKRRSHIRLSDPEFEAGLAALRG